MANLKMPEEEPADFISKKVEYMVQALRGSLDVDAKANFSRLSTDAERFAFIWGQSSTHDVIALEPEFTGKSAGNAKTHREKVWKLHIHCNYIIWHTTFLVSSIVSHCVNQSSSTLHISARLLDKD